MSNRKHTPNHNNNYIRPECTPNSNSKLSYGHGHGQSATINLLMDEHRNINGSRSRKYSLGAVNHNHNHNQDSWAIDNILLKRNQGINMGLKEVYDFGNVNSANFNNSTGLKQMQRNSKQVHKGNSDSFSIAQRIQGNQGNHGSGIALDENLTAKLVLSKKLERLQTQAIRQYYEHNVQQCWAQLDKCMQLIRQQQNPNWYLEHQLYIIYLQASFHSKLHNYAQSRQFFNQAMHLLPKLNREQEQKTKDYVISLHAIHCRLLHQEGRHAEAVTQINEFLAKSQVHAQSKDPYCKIQNSTSQTALSQKTIRSLWLIRIQASSQLHNQDETIKLCNQFIKKWSFLTCKQICKIYCILAQCHSNKGNRDQAYSLLQCAISNLTDKAQQMGNYTQHIKRGSRASSEPDQTIVHDGRTHKTQSSVSQVYSCIDKIYSTYLSLLQNQPNLIKCIEVCKKYQHQFPDSANPICNSVLLRGLYGVGDYEQCLQIYSTWAQRSVTHNFSSKDLNIIADIHFYYNDLQTAENVLNKAWDLLEAQSSKKKNTCANEELKLQMQIKMLKFIEQDITSTGKTSKRTERMRAVQRRIKQYKANPWIYQIIDLYSEYLQSIHMENRMHKITSSLGLYAKESYKQKEKQKQRSEMREADRSELLLTAKFGKCSTFMKKVLS